MLCVTVSHGAKILYLLYLWNVALQILALVYVKIHIAVDNKKYDILIDLSSPVLEIQSQSADPRQDLSRINLGYITRSKLSKSEIK
jgi:hypothetical protein